MTAQLELTPRSDKKNLLTWIVAMVLVCVADFVMGDPSGLAAWVIGLSVFFCYQMLFSKRLEGLLLAKILTRTAGGTRVSASTLSMSTRLELLQVLSRIIWTSWYLLSIVCFWGPTVLGKPTLGKSIFEVMLALCLGVVPLRLCISLALLR